MKKEQPTMMAIGMTPREKLPLLHQRMDWIGMTIIDMCIFQDYTNPDCPYTAYVEHSKTAINSIRAMIRLEENREKKRLLHLETLPRYVQDREVIQ